MKLKKFFKPLVTVSALSMLLIGCAEDSSNGNGGDSSTTTPTAESVFTDFLTGFQYAPAKNEKPLEFTTNTATKQTLKVAQGEEVQYLVSLDNVMATYYATFGITGTSTTLLTGEGSDLSSTSLSKITHYAKVDTNAEASIDLTLSNGTNSLYTGMFALMTEENVKALDTALSELDEAVELSKSGSETPDVTKIPVETVQKVVDLINGNMYKVAYNSPAQSVQDAFGKAETLTLGEGNSMKFTEGATATTFEIKTGELSFANANPTGVVQAGSVVVFLDEFKNVLNGVADGETDKNTVKGKMDLTTNQNLKITTDTLSSSATSNVITYTPATPAQAGNKVTYIAIVDDTTNIDSADSKLGALNKVIANGANKEQVEAALDELGTIYKVEYSVDTIANLIETFKASVDVKEAKSLTQNSDSYEFEIKAGALENANINVYCLVDTEEPKLELSKLDGSDATEGLTNYVKKATAKGSGGDGKITFSLTGEAQPDVPLYAYCSETVDRSGGDKFNTALDGSSTNYEQLNAFFQALQGELVVYSYTKQQ